MTTKITYKPHGVCTSQIDVELDNNIIRRVTFTGGCNGNTQGISRLVQGMTTQEVVSRLQNIDCKGKGTSCPDQLAKALTHNTIIK